MAGMSLAPMMSPVEGAGLQKPDKMAMHSTFTEGQLLENAPMSMASVITAGMDGEDQTGNAEARVGYSGRTEKMHRFLAKEFQEKQSKPLSYEGLCKGQAGKRRDLIAGCFFELLVLKTNGVINVKQDEPLSDIQISKASQWAK